MIPANLAAWAIRHGVTLAALTDLSRELGMLLEPVAAVPAGKDEAYVQSLVRLSGPAQGYHFFRNNNGAFEDATGRWVRYGLANDSEAMNKRLKSHDLIGWRSVTITPAHVGTTIAQFASRECKRPGWTWSGTDREVAQGNWGQLVTAAGGDAKFTVGEI